MFRRIADLNRYYREIEDLTSDEEGESAVKRYNIARRGNHL